MGTLKFVLYVALVVGVMCTAAGVYVTACDSIFMRAFDEEQIPCADGREMRANVSTTRVHSPSGKGRYPNQDELRYELVIMPDQKPFSEACLKFLGQQATRHPHLSFVDPESPMLVGKANLELRPQFDGADITSYKATGTMPAPADFRKVTGWNISWDLPPKPAQKPRPPEPAKVTKPERCRYKYAL